MTTGGALELEELYQRTARDFACRVVQRFGDAVHSVVLYGSVARGRAHQDSDIDILVLERSGSPSRSELVEVSEGIDFENSYRTFLLATAMTPARLWELQRGGFPIASHMLAEGVALYDDGTFERIRRETIAAGK